jgi:hypothetical protein
MTTIRLAAAYSLREDHYPSGLVCLVRDWYVDITLDLARQIVALSQFPAFEANTLDRLASIEEHVRALEAWRSEFANQHATPAPVDAGPAAGAIAGGDPSQCLLHPTPPAADPAEECPHFWEGEAKRSGEQVHALCAQLAEATALLRECRMYLPQITAGTCSGWEHHALRLARIDALLDRAKGV